MAFKEDILNLFQEVQGKTPKPRMSELASSQSDIYNRYNLLPYNPDSLVARKGMQIYDQMRVDDMVKASLTLKKFAALAPNYKIIPASQDGKDIEVADFITYTFNQMEGSMNDALFQIMTALDFGFSVTEINYLQYTEGKFKGRYGVKNLKTKRPHNYSFKVDRFDNLTKRGLINTVDGEERDLPVNKFLIFSYQKEFGNWYGTSDLRPAYRGWWSKDTIIKFWNIYLERFANPTVLGKYRSNDPTSRTNLRNILDNLTARTSITHRVDEFDIQYLEPRRNSTEDFKESIGYYDRAISRSILIPDRLVAEGQFGAYSQARVHFDVFLFVLEKLRQDLEETVITEQLIKRLVAFNFADVDKLPHFKFNPLTDAQRVELQDMFLNAVDRGVITPTLDDENYIRESLFFPEKEEEAPVVPITPEPEPKPKNNKQYDTPKQEHEAAKKKEKPKDYAEINLKPTAGMKAEAIRGLAWRKEFNRGGTPVGVARANQLKNMENLSPSTVKRMFSFFSRHEVDKKAEGFRPGEKGYPSAGRIAWALWGGDAGFSWSRKKRNQLETEQKNNAEVEGSVLQALKDKVEEHNKKVNTPKKEATTRMLGLVFKRGIGAYKTNPGSVRPGVKSPEQWAYARVNSFLSALKNEKFRGGKHDTDLFPKGHALSSK
jgi:phage gp29-like protein